MSKVFISYARQEERWAKQLADALEQSGFSVWWDRQLVAGASWANLIEKELDRASCVLVLWSASSVASNWVREEAAYARELNKLIPVLVENVELPLGFRNLENVVLTGWTGEPNHPGFVRLVEAISNRLHR